MRARDMSFPAGWADGPRRFAPGRPRDRLPPEAVLLGWAGRHFRHEGVWPTARSGAVAAAPGWTWQRVDTLLRRNLAGRPGGDSLARLLERHGRRRRWARR